MPQSSSASGVTAPTRLRQWPVYPYPMSVRLSLWAGVLVAAGLFGWGAWQRR